MRPPLPPAVEFHRICQMVNQTFIGQWWPGVDITVRLGPNTYSLRAGRIMSQGVQ